MSRQFEVDRTVCSGDTGKAGLTALNPGTSDRYNGAVAVERGALSNNVMRGCMAEKGYVLVREKRRYPQRPLNMRRPALSRLAKTRRYKVQRPAPSALQALGRTALQAEVPKPEAASRVAS
jgi:hypothetical protein